MPARVEDDGDRLRQVISNLVGNAIKFTDVGEVVVRANAKRLADDRCLLELTVVDTGIGIDASQQALLFEAFSQLDEFQRVKRQLSQIVLLKPPRERRPAARPTRRATRKLRLTARSLRPPGCSATHPL